MHRLVLIIALYLLTCVSVGAVDLAETKDLAEKGDAWYQTELALMHHNGQGMPQNYAKAVEWYTRAADQGFARAQANLGVMYGKGQGVPQDYGVALTWFRMAAYQGNSLAQHNLGLMYGRGQGVPQDYTEAYAWEALAARSGHENAIKNRDSIAANFSPEELVTAQRHVTRLFLEIKRRKAKE